MISLSERNKIRLFPDLPLSQLRLSPQDGRHLCILFYTWGITRLCDLLLKRCHLLVNALRILGDLYISRSFNRMASGEIDRALAAGANRQTIKSFAAGPDGDYHIVTDEQTLCSCRKQPDIISCEC